MKFFDFDDLYGELQGKSSNVITRYLDIWYKGTRDNELNDTINRLTQSWFGIYDFLATQPALKILCERDEPYLGQSNLCHNGFVMNEPADHESPHTFVFFLMTSFATFLSLSFVQTWYPRKPLCPQRKAPNGTEWSSHNSANGGAGTSQVVPREW